MNKSASFKKKVYISMIAVCCAVVVGLTGAIAFQMVENHRLKEEQKEVIEKFEDLARENENLKDENYAQVYFDGGSMYIPAKDVVIEYKP